VGGGYIGGEVAASLRQKGLEPTVVAREKVLWEHVFVAPVAMAFPRKLEGGGVRVVNGDTVVRIEGQGRAERVVTERGLTIECDAVVGGIGAAPRLELVEGTSIKVDKGVLVDRFLRTSARGIYAAGDIARFYSPLYGMRLRVEHWDVAEKHGLLAGRNIAREAAGKASTRESFDEPPYFYSDLFDLALEYLGSGRPTDSVVVRGEVEGGSFSAFYVRRGRLMGAAFVNRNEEVEPVKALIQQRLRVDARVRRQLGDPASDLGALGAANVQ
jgi:3-phenylpropionate/trans-cinnamate dioxygenase ferredoxin reductase subunit